MHYWVVFVVKTSKGKENEHILDFGLETLAFEYAEKVMTIFSNLVSCKVYNHFRYRSDELIKTYL